MERELLKSKIHRARVTETDLAYEGSVTIGRDLLDAAEIAPYERVQVVNVTNGERLETYAIEGDDGEVCLNGAAARRGEVGDVVILISYAIYPEREAADPTIVRVDDRNRVLDTGAIPAED